MQALAFLPHFLTPSCPLPSVISWTAENVLGTANKDMELAGKDMARLEPWLRARAQALAGQRSKLDPAAL